MEQHHRNIIKTNTEKLLEKIDYDSISPVLVERGLFTRAMVEDIEEPSNKKDKLLLLLQELPTRGPEAFGRFVNLLLDKDQLEAAQILHPTQEENTFQLDVRNNNTPTERVRVEQPSSGELTVRKAVDLRTGSKIYKMTSKPRGLCLIINNVKFPDKPREGSDVDLARADKTFIQLDFKVFIRSDLNCKDMFEELKKFSQRPEHRDLDSVVVVILTHGMKDVVYGVDYQPLSVVTIYNLFNNQHCPGLTGKPKMFFIQACRGVKIDYGVRENVSADAFSRLPSSVEVPTTTSDHRTVDDIIIVQASAPEYCAFRNEIGGSWFINSLTCVLIRCAWEDHLLEMINEVDRLIKRRVGLQGERQTTSSNNIGFSKDLYFNPGL